MFCSVLCCSKHLACAEFVCEEQKQCENRMQMQFQLQLQLHHQLLHLLSNYEFNPLPLFSITIPHRNGQERTHKKTSAAGSLHRAHSFPLHRICTQAIWRTIQWKCMSKLNVNYNNICNDSDCFCFELTQSTIWFSNSTGKIINASNCERYCEGLLCKIPLSQVSLRSKKQEQFAPNEEKFRRVVDFFSESVGGSDRWL